MAAVPTPLTVACYVNWHQLCTVSACVCSCHAKASINREDKR